MIIGYYEQSFFGGGTYYKLSKKDEETKYKIEYSHCSIPNNIPKAEEYIKKYDTLSLEEERWKEDFEGKIKVDYIEMNSYIETLMTDINKCDWESISKKEYRDDGILDGLGWDFYIEFNNKKFEIHGYEKFPEEVLKVLEILKNISETYLEKIVPNKKDIEIIMSHKKSNISFMKHLRKKKVIDKKQLKDFIEHYKKYE